VRDLPLRFCLCAKIRNWPRAAGVTEVMRAKRLILAPCLAAGLLYGAASGFLAAQRKMDLIESSKLRPSSRVTFAKAELNDWVQHEAARLYPGSVRNPAVDLGPGIATGTALIDFAKLRRAQGNPPGMLMSRLLDGERPVKVTARVTSGAGQATVDVQSVEISGLTIDGPVLDYMIRSYLLPNYPTAKVGEPFKLGYNIERVELQPSALNVLIGR
jgi:hypothetical protein